MNILLCRLDELVVWLARIYSIILLVYAVVSWIPDIRGRWTDYLAMVVEPVLAPIRRVIPPIGGLDLAFLVLILLLNYLIVPLLINVAFNACAVVD